jgi:hypothetical protein
MILVLLLLLLLLLLLALQLLGLVGCCRKRLLLLWAALDMARGSAAAAAAAVAAAAGNLGVGAAADSGSSAQPSPLQGTADDGTVLRLAIKGLELPERASQEVGGHHIVTCNMHDVTAIMHIIRNALCYRSDTLCRRLLTCHVIVTFAIDYTM